MHKMMLEAKYLHADETVMQVMAEPGRKNTTKSYMWVYGTYKDSKTPILDEFFARVENNINQTLPKSKLGKASQYIQN